MTVDNVEQFLSIIFRLSPATSGRSSVSTPDQQPWASFEDSDVEGEIRSRSPGTEHLNLLEHSVDEDQNSVDNASLASDDDPFSISDTLRQYYTNCFTNLQEKIYKSKDLNAAIPGSHPETMAFFEVRMFTCYFKSITGITHWGFGCRSPIFLVTSCHIFGTCQISIKMGF